jgi:hypothetical protein
MNADAPPGTGLGRTGAGTDPSGVPGPAPKPIASVVDVDDVVVVATTPKGVGADVVVELTGAVTVIAPCIEAWTRQWYAYRPGWLN